VSSIFKEGGRLRGKGRWEATNLRFSFAPSLFKERLGKVFISPCED
jgi:hypothetical protein